MIYAVTGQRGVGKTLFLERVRKYYGDRNLEVRTLDLDQELVSRERKSIELIFGEHGEQHFRRLEIEVFAELVREVRNETLPVFIALGAGFKGELPMDVKVLWLRRATDQAGRIFLNRPRLEPGMKPLEEYRERAHVREQSFQAIYHKEISLTEGYTEANDIEPVLLGLTPYNLRAMITVLPQIFNHEVRLEDFIAEKLLLGTERFELRDDLLTVAQMERFAAEVPADRVLFSFRTQDQGAIKEDWRSAKLYGGSIYDWALELGPCPFGEPAILSLHRRGPDETLAEAGERLCSGRGRQYKLAVLVNDFVELWQGHQWYLQDPSRRSFLPVSVDGRWSWYRLVHGNNMPVKFVREGSGSAPDQPTLFDWINARGVRRESTITNFAAVLGDPVLHSRTPHEHEKFFAKKEMPVVRLRMSESEFNVLNIGILQRLGLTAAAITSPLKEKAFNICTEQTVEATNLRAVNTLSWDSKRNVWLGTNTDVLALQSIFSNMALPPQVAVWGGGGTVLALRQVLPQARFFTARQGATEGDASPQMLVWAVGRDRMSECKYPPESWRPLMILDLNYGDNSPGREYAQMTGAQYISGLEMFKLQARAQREFWSAPADNRIFGERSL